MWHLTCSNSRGYQLQASIHPATTETNHHHALRKNHPRHRRFSQYGARQRACAGCGRRPSSRALRLCVKEADGVAAVYERSNSATVSRATALASGRPIEMRTHVSRGG